MILQEELYTFEIGIAKINATLGEKRKNLNEDIGNLVSKGISIDVQKALDSVRVIGNDAVHPGELDLTDNVSIAIVLFRLINHIIENQISSKKEIDEIYACLLDNKVKRIENRDK